MFDLRHGIATAAASAAACAISAIATTFFQLFPPSTAFSGTTIVSPGPIGEESTPPARPWAAAPARHRPICTNDEYGFLVGQPRGSPGTREIPPRIFSGRVRDRVRVVHLPDNRHEPRLLRNLQRVSRAKFEVIRRPRKAFLALPDVHHQPARNRRSPQRLQNPLPLLHRGLLKRGLFVPRCRDCCFHYRRFLLQPLDQLLPVFLLHLAHFDSFEHCRLRVARRQQTPCSLQQRTEPFAGPYSVNT